MSLIRKIKQKFSSKDARALLENFISLSALQLVGMVLPLITLPYVLRVIGFEKYGIIVFSTSLIAYFQSLTDYSFKITAVREVSLNRNCRKELSRIYSKVMIIKCFFLIISLLIIFGIVGFIDTFYSNKEIYLLVSLMLVGYTIFPDWYFQGIEKMRYITYLNVGIKVFFTICIFIFIKKEEQYWIYPLLQSFGFIGAGIVGQIILLKKFEVVFCMPSYYQIKECIKSNFPLFVNQFVPNLYNNTSIFLLGLIESKSVVGIYQAIVTIVNLGITLIEIISRVFFPYLNRMKSAFKTYRNIVLLVYLAIVVTFLIGNKILFWFLNIHDENALFILIVLLIGISGYVLDNIYGLNYFIVNNKDKLVMYNTIIASLIGIVIAYPLISKFGIIGCALTLTFTRCIMGGRIFFKFLNESK